MAGVDFLAISLLVNNSDSPETGYILQRIWLPASDSGSVSLAMKIVVPCALLGHCAMPVMWLYRRIACNLQPVLALDEASFKMLFAVCFDGVPSIIKSVFSTGLI
jgi:hypothetical protein